jgi:hypothetical protein
MNEMRKFSHEMFKSQNAQETYASLLHMHIGVCASALSHLNREERDIMSGESKSILGGWWLRTIEIETETFLRSNSFDFEAVPEDYLISPPSNLNSIESNWKIITAVLKQGSSRNRKLVNLIEQLKSQIYPKIEHYIGQANIVLRRQLRLKMKHYSLETANEKFALYRNDPMFWEKPDCVDAVEKLLADIAYLLRMKQLEEQRDPAEHHVVPISGLVYAAIARVGESMASCVLTLAENEVRTVLEVWGQEASNQQQHFKRESGRASLQNAAIRHVKSDTKRAQQRDEQERRKEQADEEARSPHSPKRVTRKSKARTSVDLAVIHSH